MLLQNRAAAVFFAILALICLIPACSAISEAANVNPEPIAPTMCPNTTVAPCKSTVAGTDYTYCPDQTATPTCCNCQTLGSGDIMCYSCPKDVTCTWKPGNGAWCMTTAELVGICVGICIGAILVLMGTIFLISACCKCCKSGNASKKDVSDWYK